MFLLLLAGRFSFNAGSMTVLFKGNETIYVLGKGVRVRTSDYRIRGSHGTYYEKSGRVYLYRAHITSDRLTMEADTLFYNRKSNLLRLRGNAHFEDEYRKVRGNVIIAKGDSAWVAGNVYVEAKRKGVVVEGDSAFYDGREAFGYVLGNARSMILRKDTVEVRASMFILHRDTTYGVGDVVARAKKFIARGDTLRAILADTVLKEILISGQARVEWEGGEGKSKSVIITFKEGEVESILFRDSAHVVYREGASTIELSGQLIRAKMEGDRLRHIYVERLWEGKYR
ncbi:MAG: hypothetical protein GXO39_01690 [Thermotogae bacterium]|nr:hypothetical protein [Thermotogota bacterium]